MNRLRGYLRTLRAYGRTPKGAFDRRDYLRAAGMILLTSILAAAVAVVLYDLF